jgi:hypothetical protein
MEARSRGASLGSTWTPDKRLPSNGKNVRVNSVQQSRRPNYYTTKERMNLSRDPSSLNRQKRGVCGLLPRLYRVADMTWGYEFSGRQETQLSTLRDAQSPSALLRRDFGTKRMQKGRRSAHRPCLVDITMFGGCPN